MADPTRDELRHRLRRAQRVVAASLGTALALALVVLFAVRAPGRLTGIDAQAAIDDPALRGELIRLLSDQVRGFWDSHNDPDVSYVCLPHLQDFDAGNTLVTTSSIGMREAEYELPKPPGLTRIVLLGDSWVFGVGARAEDRVGAFLERFLLERAVGPGRLEVLHVGVSSWNVIAECAYLRRQLGLLQPDLVIHVTCANDLDDVTGVRGFGGQSRFSPRRRQYADSIVRSDHATRVFRLPIANHLITGLGFESRRRYEESAAAIERLVDALERRGAEYLMLLHWGGGSNYARAFLVPDLDERRLAVLPGSFRADPANWVEPENQHWNRAAMERVATLLYGILHERGLLGGWELAEWPAATRAVAELHAVGIAEARSPLDRSGWLDARPIRDEWTFAELDEAAIAQIEGGVDPNGLVSPSAVLILRSHDRGTLSIEGMALARPEIDGTRVEVFADEVALGALTLSAGEPVRGSWPLPAELDGREYVDVRLVADDYAYVGADVRHCVVFRLERVAIAP